MVPVEYDREGEVIDGHHRIKVCQELGITDWPRIVRDYADDAAKRTQARKLNIARRHLDAKAKRALIADELKDRPQFSNRAIGADLGVSHHTVDDVREKLEQGGQIAHQSEVIGRDGVKQAICGGPLTRPFYPG